MAKGKRGPTPEAKTREEIEAEAAGDPTAEEIVGAENVIDVGVVVDVHSRDCIAEWAEIIGVPAHRISLRLRRGWTPEQALSMEKHARRNRESTISV